MIPNIDAENEKREEYIKMLFKKYHTFTYWGTKKRPTGFYLKHRTKNLYEVIQNWFEERGYPFYSIRDEEEKYDNEQKIYLALASEGTQIAFEVSRFKTFEELKTIANQFKEYIFQYTLDTIFINEGFVRQRKGKNMGKVHKLYEKAKWTESFIEEQEKRKVFKQLDSLGKFQNGTYDKVKIKHPHGYFTYDVDVNNEDEIVIEKVQMRRPKDQSKKEQVLTLETETVEVFEGLFTKVFSFQSSDEIYDYYRYKEDLISFDLVKTKNNGTRLQGLYLKNVDKGSACLSIRTDSRYANQEELNPYIQLGLTDKIGDF